MFSVAPVNGSSVMCSKALHQVRVFVLSTCIHMVCFCIVFYPRTCLCIYLEVAKFSNALNLAILYQTKLAHTNFTNSVNLLIV